MSLGTSISSKVRELEMVRSLRCTSDEEESRELEAEVLPPAMLGIGTGSCRGIASKAASSASSWRRRSSTDWVGVGATGGVAGGELKRLGAEGFVRVVAFAAPCLRRAAPEAIIPGPYERHSEVASCAGPETGSPILGGAPVSEMPVAGVKLACCGCWPKEAATWSQIARKRSCKKAYTRALNEASAASIWDSWVWKNGWRWWMYKYEEPRVCGKARYRRKMVLRV